MTANPLRLMAQKSVTRITIRQSLAAVGLRPADKGVIDPNERYMTQRRHWPEWILEYNARVNWRIVPWHFAAETSWLKNGGTAK